jgi:hypothetical protein
VMRILLFFIFKLFNIVKCWPCLSIYQWFFHGCVFNIWYSLDGPSNLARPFLAFVICQA